jgi:hypothetical protein
LKILFSSEDKTKEISNHSESFCRRFQEIENTVEYFKQEGKIKPENGEMVFHAY